MPAKRRVSKRRLDSTVPLEAWEAVFLYGNDYFGDLKRHGYASAETMRRDARDAWRRLGDAFLREYDGETAPWALSAFGEPRGR
jgi:hypothetical protein